MKKMMIVIILLLVSLSITFAGPSFPDKETDAVFPIGRDCCCTENSNY